MVPKYDMPTDVRWIKDLEHVFKYGNRVAPRDMLVYESMAYKSVVDMNTPIIFNRHRNLGYKFMAAEAAWILDGRNDVKSIQPYSKEIAKFSDDGDKFFGAYGPKIVFQLNHVIGSLIADIDSRQAVINIWRESPGPSKDIPCTLSLQWLVRHNTLHCVASMRSSDLWLGHPYDIFNFSAVSFYILMQLNRRLDKKIELGQLHLTAGSKHIYERNISDVGTIIEDYYENGVATSMRTRPFWEERYSEPEEFIAHLWEVAESSDGAKTLIGEC